MKDYHTRYYDGSLGGAKNILHSGAINADIRIMNGMIIGYSHGRKILSSLKTGEKIKIVTHSMGAAYAKGFITGLQIYSQLKRKNIDGLVQLEVDLALYQPDKQRANKSVHTIVIAHKYDNIAGCEPMEDADNHVTRRDQSRYNFKSEHSIESFTTDELERYVPSGDPSEGGANKKWEQNGSNQ